MKQLLKITIYACLLFIICLTKTFGQTTTNEITDRFFEIYSTNPAKAVDYIFSTNKWTDRKVDEITGLKNKLNNLIVLCGDYYGHDMLSKKTAGLNIIMVTFIIKYDREPLRFSFYFYKPKDKWQLNNFSFDEDIDKDLEEAAKAYRLNENINL